MARLPRLSIAGLPHHVLQRGVGGQPVFADETDCLQYLQLLRQAARDHALAVHAYLLLPTEIHWIATPDQAGGVGRAVQALARHYVRWFNQRHARRGTLFEGRYRAAVVQPDHHLLASIRYIEGLPVELGMVSAAADYRWSSYKHHAGTQVDPLVRDPAAYWALGNTPFDRQAAYVHLMSERVLTSETRQVERAVRGSWAIGDTAFLARVGRSRQATPRAAGRPRKRSDPDFATKPRSK